MTTADFESIVRAHQGMVYSIAYHFFRNAAVAEDVAQDVFLQLFTQRELVAPDHHAVAWLRRVTAHRCIDRARHRSHRSEIQFDELPNLPFSPSDHDPLLQGRLHKLVSSLPAVHRLVVILRYGEDLDVDEIARMLSIPTSTAASHLRRALSLLRAKAARYLMQEPHEQVR